MAVEQPTKGKVRPVFDYRELNQHVSCHTGDDNTDICSEKLREWRKIEGDAEIVDLKCAYPTTAIAVVAPPFFQPDLKNGVDRFADVYISYSTRAPKSPISASFLRPYTACNTFQMYCNGKILPQRTRCRKPRVDIPNTLVFMTYRNTPFCI